MIGGMYWVEVIESVNIFPIVTFSTLQAAAWQIGFSTL